MHTIRAIGRSPVGTLIFFVLISAAGLGQNIRVDATPGHAAKSFSPTTALGAGIDRIPTAATDKLFTAPVMNQVLSADGKPSAIARTLSCLSKPGTGTRKAAGVIPPDKGYFTGSATPGAPIRHSFGYLLPHRGFTRNDGVDTGYSRLTDGDPNTYWKSNPYLTRAFTGEDDSVYPQWVIMDLANNQMINAHAHRLGRALRPPLCGAVLDRRRSHQTGHKGTWVAFPGGAVENGGADCGNQALGRPDAGALYSHLDDRILQHLRHSWFRRSAQLRRLRHSRALPRNRFCGRKVSRLVRHTPDPDQTATICSSVDPWHEPSDLSEKRDQVGFDLFYTSGYTRGLPAMIPIALLYGTPEDSVAQIAYLKARGYPISYIEMGEEPDGQFMLPEQYGALYLQWATALHRR